MDFLHHPVFTLALWDSLFSWVDAILNNVWGQDSIVLAGFALFLTPIFVSAKSERWQRAWSRLRRDRLGIVTGAIICLYLFVGLLEMIHLPHGNGGTPVSLIDLMTSGI